nr:hypothetical protein [Chromobacterium sp. Beijing]
MAGKACARLPRIAILDTDMHHGQGTQDIFYARDDTYSSPSTAIPPISTGGGRLRRRMRRRRRPGSQSEPAPAPWQR